jgi:hypothetical protein
MSNRSRPLVVSTRVEIENAALVRALAEIEGQTVCQIVHEILISAVRDRLAALVTPAAEDQPEAGS